MRIIDHDLCPSEFGPVAFEPASDDTSGQDTFVLTGRGVHLGTMAPLRLDHGEVVVVGDDEDGVIQGPGLWILETAGSGDDETRRHILWVAEEGDSPSLTGELAVWATLTTVRAMTGRPFARG